MDIISLQKQIDTLSKKLDAICEYYGIDIGYEPEKYTVAPEEDQEENDDK